MSNNGFLEEFDQGILIGDGAIGSALFARGVTPEEGVERMNLLNPDLVLRLHRDYIAAGSRVIETNTFGANAIGLAAYDVRSDDEVREIILAGARLARTAAGSDAYVAGSLGPLPNVDGESICPSDQTLIYSTWVSDLLDGGVDIIMLESFASLEELVLAVKAARSITKLPIVAQAAFGAQGFTADGFSAAEVARRCSEAGADVIGANCGYGVHSVLTAIREMASSNVRMSAYLNAGFPERAEGRLVYLASPEYLASRAVALVGLGARLIGGCCGTGPETIRYMAAAIKAEKTPTTHLRPVTTDSRIPVVSQKPVVRRMPDKFPILVELDPPTNLNIDPLITAAHALKEAGATVITVADNPLASVRADSLAVASILQREAGLPVMPHLTGRDRNRIAIQSTIMGAHVMGIRSLLCVTGDPVRMCQEPNTSGVFDLTSVGLVRMVSDFNEGHRMTGDYRTEFSIGVALNPNVRTISGQIDKLKRKMDAGANFALTQPVFEDDKLDILQTALSDSGIELPIYLGIMPLLSARNAEFLHNEVPGITIPDEIRSKLSGYESVPEQRKAGIEIAAGFVERFAPRVQGLYFICPRNKVEAVLPLVRLAVTDAAV